MTAWDPGWRTMAPMTMADALEAAGVPRHNFTWAMFLKWATGAGYVVVDEAARPRCFRVPVSMAPAAVVAEYLAAGMPIGAQGRGS